MSPQVATPEAHLHPREWWDSFTSAVANAFDIGGDSTTDSSNSNATTTTKIVKTVTAGADDVTTATVKTIHTTIHVTTTSPKPAATNHVVKTTTTPDSLPTAIVPLSQSVSDSTLALAPTTTNPIVLSSAPGGLAGADQFTSAQASATATAAPTNSGDGNTGAKAGIAIGVLAGVLGIFILVWFLFNRRRKQMEKQRLADDEKINGAIGGPSNPFADSAAIRTPAKAPRLSLRPVTQFLPNLGALPDRRTSRGAGAMLNAEPQISQLQRPTGGSAWERPTMNSAAMHNAATWDQPGPALNAHPANPFNDNQRIPEEPEQSRSNSPNGPVHGPFGYVTSGSPPHSVSPINGHDHEYGMDGGAAAATAATAAAAVAGGAAAAGLVRKASIRKDGPRPLDLTMPPPPAPTSAVPPSPAGTEFSMHSVAPGQPLGPSTSAAAIAAAGGPPQSTVHRVTLDFKPTLEDEMGLTAGQLVRLLHEYDDGWALCIRLDRSQQGVVPRTCLSTRPVKPRPAPGGGPRGPPINPTRGPGYPPNGPGPRGPPNGPNGGGYPRPQSPAGSMGGGYPPQGRPQSPAGYPQGGRPHSPAGYPQGGRPQSPAGYPLQGRPQSPAGYLQGGRPQSPAGRPMSPGPRSQSPAGPRYQQGPRPQSPSGMGGRRMSPPGPSQMSQQYAPGQAY